MFEVSVCTSIVFVCLALDGPGPTGGGASSPCIWESGMLVSLPSGECEMLEKMGAMAVLPDSGFTLALGYMAYYPSPGIDGLQCTSSGFHMILVWVKCMMFCHVVVFNPSPYCRWRVQ